MSLNNEDKLVWCGLGEEAEKNFAGPPFFDGVAVFANPGKMKDRYTHDLFIMQPADLKTIRTPFLTSDRYGIPARTAITLNVKDVERYSDLYPRITIIFDIQFDDFKSIRYAGLHEIKRAIKGGFAKVHTYQNRVNDTQGNAKESYVLNALWFDELRRGG
jgi:hypothetical protein